MRKTIKILSLFLLCGCVSTAEYHRLKDETEIVARKKKELNKEIRLAEDLNRKLEDSIMRINENSKLETYKIEKRLAKHGIIVKLDPEQLMKLRVENQSIDEDYYKTFKKSNNFTDTNSAKKTEWLTKKEKELMYWLNYARLNPKKFCMKYIYPHYLKDKNNVYIATLMDYMLSMKPVPALIPDKILFESALCHAESMGKAGKFGHARLEGCKSTFRGECCSYGVDDPLSIVIQLLIDKNVSSLGHRYICMGTYTKLGVSIKPHKTYKINAVLDFSNK